MFGWGNKTDTTAPSLDSLVAENRCVMFSMPSCPWCTKAEDFLAKKKLKCKIVNLQESQFLAFEVIKATGQRTVPNIFIDGQHVGGHDSLLESFDKCQKVAKGDTNAPIYCDYFKGSKRR
jgi:glutaredoxin 3